MEIQTKKRNIVISKKTVAISILIIIALLFIGKEAAYGIKLLRIRNYAQQAGLTNVSVEKSQYSKYSITLRCDNFKDHNWDALMELDQNIRSIDDNVQIYYEQDQTEYSIYNNIISTTSYTDDRRIEYDGSWERSHSINLETERRKRQEQSQRIQEAIDNNRDSRISTSQCCICGKQATQQIDGDYYCTEHYSDAYDWYVEKAAKKLVEEQ